MYLCDSGHKLIRYSCLFPCTLNYTKQSAVLLYLVREISFEVQYRIYTGFKCDTLDCELGVLQTKELPRREYARVIRYRKTKLVSFKIPNYIFETQYISEKFFDYIIANTMLFHTISLVHVRTL